MNQKKTAHKVTPKATDVTNTKKITVNSSEQPLIIPKRSIIGREEAKISLSEEPEEPIVSPISRKTIIPVNNGAAQPAVSTEDKTTDTAPSSAPKESSEDETVPPKEEGVATTADSPTVTTDDNDTTEQPKTDNQEDIEKTAAAVKRERELQEYIKNRKYFVPVNTAAEKKSIKVSFGLVFLILILGFVFIDLLLDTGAIFLVQKIPHTHFFTIGSNS